MTHRFEVASTRPFLLAHFWKFEYHRCLPRSPPHQARQFCNARPSRYSWTMSWSWPVADRIAVLDLARAHFRLDWSLRGTGSRRTCSAHSKSSDTNFACSNLRRASDRRPSWKARRPLTTNLPSARYIRDPWSILAPHSMASHKLLPTFPRLCTYLTSQSRPFWGWAVRQGANFQVSHLCAQFRAFPSRSAPVWVTGKDDKPPLLWVCSWTWYSWIVRHCSSVPWWERDGAVSQLSRKVGLCAGDAQSSKCGFRAQLAPHHSHRLFCFSPKFW